MKRPRSQSLPLCVLLLVGGHLCRLHAASPTSNPQSSAFYQGTYQTDNSFGSAAEKQAALQQIDAVIASLDQQMRITPSETRPTLAMMQDARRRMANAPIRAGGAAGAAAGTPAQQMFVNQMMATYEQLKADMDKMDAAVREQAQKDRAFYGQKEAEGVSRINRAAGQALSDLDALEAKEKGGSSDAAAADAARQRQQRVLQYLDRRNDLIVEIQAGGMSAEMAEVRANAIVSEMLASEGLDWSMAVIQDPQTFQPGAAFSAYPMVPPASAGAVVPYAPGGSAVQDGNDLDRAYMESYFANVRRGPDYVPTSPWRAPTMVPENLPPPPASAYDKARSWVVNQYENSIAQPLSDKWNSLWNRAPSITPPSPPRNPDALWNAASNINHGLAYSNAFLISDPTAKDALKAMTDANQAFLDNHGDTVGMGKDVAIGIGVGIGTKYYNPPNVPPELRDLGIQTVIEAYKNPDARPGQALGNAAQGEQHSVMEDILSQLGIARGH